MKKNTLILLSLILLLALTFAVSLIFGGTRISLSELLSANQASGIMHTIIWKIRIPRIILMITNNYPGLEYLKKTKMVPFLLKLKSLKVV